MEGKYDFGGWATRNDVKCADGRTIRKDAFKAQDGQKVPLVYNHDHNSVDNVLGHAILENREEGVYAYCSFNETESGNQAKALVEHGDVASLSIYANKLTENKNGDVFHGVIREVSLVLAGANPGAFIDTVLSHNDEDGDGLIIGCDENIMLYHSDCDPDSKNPEKTNDKEKTVEDVINSMTEEQQNVMWALVADAAGKTGDENEDENEDEKGDGEMKQNIFDQDNKDNKNVLQHSDQEAIIVLAKKSGSGSFKDAYYEYMKDNGKELAHGVMTDQDLTTLLPEYTDVYGKEPYLITRDMTWVDSVINKVHKTPVTRIRTRQFDAKKSGIRAKGYVKGSRKTDIGDIELLGRTTDPQTIYVRDELNRDDILDFTDFNLVDYNWKLMRTAMNEEIAIDIMVGDGRTAGDPDKVKADHIRPIWTDNELYTIHYDIDLEGTETELQGTDTSKHFSNEYIFAEAFIKGALYAREQYKGSGNLTLYVTPHTLNQMLLARDFNGRRIYESKKDLEAALNVSSIETAEQFEGLQREDADHNMHNLLGIFVNLSDYNVGCAKGGEITRFEDFDINFNKEQFLMETRISGALTRIKSAIVLEKPVTATEEDEDEDDE